MTLLEAMIVGGVVTLACLYLGLMAWRKWQKRGGGCGCGCGPSPSKPKRVSLTMQGKHMRSR